MFSRQYGALAKLEAQGALFLVTTVCHSLDRTSYTGGQTLPSKPSRKPLTDRVRRANLDVSATETCIGRTRCQRGYKDQQHACAGFTGLMVSAEWAQRHTLVLYGNGITLTVK